MSSRKAIFFLAVPVCIAVVVAVGTSGFCEEEKGGYKPAAEKYSSVLGIATREDPFFPSRITTSTGNMVSSEEFLEPEECKMCHSTIYGQWKGSMHSNAWNDPIYQAMLRIAGKETKGFTDKLCLGCHTPVGVISGETPPVYPAELSKVAANGVFCDFCHTISGATGIGNLPVVSEPGDVKRGPFKDSESPFHEVAFSEMHTTPEFCGLCHNVSHPVNGLPIEQTYTEWLMGPYRAAGIICQDCHMTPPDPPTAFTKNPGRPCIMGPERDHWWTHQFAGGNVMVTELLGSKKHGEHARNRLKAAARVEILPPDAIALPGLLEFKVKVSNVGCGHYLPTGLTEIREMWLDVIVSDAGGKELYRSGALDEAGEIDPDAVVYHTVIGDEDGRPTWKIWEAARVLYDYRIPPKGYRIERYAAYVPADAKPPFTVRARLRYRSIAPHLVKILLPDEDLVVPIVEMAEAKASVK